jgi:hypothetical protein
LTEAQETVARRLRWQASACRMIGSPLYDLLLTRAAEDVEQGGPVWSVLEGHASDATESMLGLRLMAGVHRVVLRGEGSGLASIYPSVGGQVDAARAWPEFRALVTERRDELRALTGRPCQTNEVGRCAPLLGGFGLVARRSGLPLRLREIGASAGLNLCFDRYFYSGAGLSFGDPASRVRFEDVVSEGRPPFDQGLEVSERRGCDASPLDATSEEDRLTLLSSVWPDQAGRIEQLRAALDLVAADPPVVERASAGGWLEQALRERRPGNATVLFHSMVWQYLSDTERERVKGAIEAAGAEAVADAPVAWLRLELGGELADVHLTTWPGGEESLIARAGYHGRPVHWLEHGGSL